MHADGGLLERDAITGAIADLVERVAAGRAGAVFLVGEAGLGKTTLVSRACHLAAEAGLTTRASRGHPLEAGLPFGVLAQAIEEAAGSVLLNGGSPGPASGTAWAARCYQVLHWIRQRDGSPLFLGIDDLHWADADSLSLLSFISRRMTSAPFGLVASMRPWPASAAETATALADEGHGTVLRLAPLSGNAAASLLRSRLGRDIPASTAEHACELTAGNPLLLGQLAAGMADGTALADVAGLEAGAPGSDLFRHGVLLSRFAGLPPAGMGCARAAAVLGPGFRPEIAAEVAGLNGGDVDEAIEALSQTGLIGQADGAGADFTHPLFRQALYEDIPGPVRSRLHARAFAVLHARGMDTRAAEHAVRARLAGDAEAVAVLEAAGRASRRAGAAASAVYWLDNATTLAGDAASARLIADLAEALLVSGAADRSASVCHALLTREGLDNRTRVEALWMLARARIVTGGRDLAALAFEEAASHAGADDPPTAAEILLDAAYCGWLSGELAPVLRLADRARKLASRAGDPLRTRAETDWAMYALMAGDPAGVAAAEAAAASWRSAGDTRLGTTPETWRGGWGPAYSFAYCAVGVERFAEADDAFTVARDIAERAGAPFAIAGLAVGHSFCLYRMGRLREALASSEVAVSLIELVPWIGAYASLGKAQVSLHLGDLEGSARWAERAARLAAEHGQRNAQLYQYDLAGHRLLREGAIAGACEAYDRLQDLARRVGVGDPGVCPWARHAVSAYLAGGRTADAERIVAWLDDISPRLPGRFPKIAAASGRAQLCELAGDHDAADAGYRSALALQPASVLLLEHCETLLAYGGFLRRSGALPSARRVLGQAVETAERAGAAWLAGLAHQELKVAGGRRRRRPEPGTLTAQERRVAALVATGATNGQVARQLCLSVSTIETHLEHIYAKLGIHNRYQLIVVPERASDG